MSNVIAHVVVGPRYGCNCSLSLNGPQAWAAPGGSNVATLSTTAGDLWIRSAGGLGMTVNGSSCFVGVGGITVPQQAMDVSGNVTVSGTVTAMDSVGTSDTRLKTNIKTVESALDVVCSLRGVSFDWRSTNHPAYGLIAQEVQPILPSVVTTDANGMLGISYNGIIPWLVEAVKALKLENEALREQVRQMTGA